MISEGKSSLVVGALIILGIGSGLIACRKSTSDYMTLEGQAQGTTFHITYLDGSARDFSVEIDSLFKRIDQSMSLWDSTSLISRINRNDTTVSLDPHFRRVFGRAMEIADSTGGAFDVTVGPLVRAWGFSTKQLGPPPDSSRTDSLLQLTGYQRVKLSGNRLLKEDPRIQLDLNAIAQGYTVDLISEFLQSKGIEHFLVELGGEVRAQGVNERDSIWVIGIDMPEETPSGQRPLQATLPLKNKALATSGSYRKYLKKDGIRWSHIINPNTGYPTHDSLLSVSVLANDAMTADALATAFLVRGLERCVLDAALLNVDVYCIYQTHDGKLKTRSTPGFFQ